MTNAPILESERLRLRRWTQADFDHYADYYRQEELSRFVGGPCDRNHAWRRFAAEVGHWELRGYGFWLVEDKSKGRFAGSVGLWYPEGWPEMELSYWLHPSVQGLGYATEAALRVRRYAYEKLGATTLISTIDPANGPSQKVAERIGAKLESRIELAQFGPHDIYRHPGPGQSMAQSELR